MRKLTLPLHNILPQSALRAATNAEFGTDLIPCKQNAGRACYLAGAKASDWAEQQSQQAYARLATQPIFCPCLPQIRLD